MQTNCLLLFFVPQYIICKTCHIMTLINVCKGTAKRMSLKMCNGALRANNFVV